MYERNIHHSRISEINISLHIVSYLYEGTHTHTSMGSNLYPLFITNLVIIMPFKLHYFSFSRKAELIVIQYLCLNDIFRIYYFHTHFFPFSMHPAIIRGTHVCLLRVMRTQII